MKKLLSLFAVMMLVPILYASADELVYYTNDNGVDFTEEEYDFISNFYFEGYQDYMTQSDYNDFISSNIMNLEISIQTVDDMQLVPVEGGQTRDTQYYETSMKKLKLSTACTSDECAVSTTLTWKSVPATKSYDHIGAYFYNTSRVSGTVVNSKLFYNGNIVYPSHSSNDSNGIDATFKYPNTTYEVEVIQVYRVKKQGTLYVSYQHAANSISSANSQLFSFSYSGYGHVFLFHSSIRSKYDNMGGLQKTF